MNILLGYIIVSYAVGTLLIFYEIHRGLLSKNNIPVWFSLILLLLSPLTAWHGVLHYAALFWCKLNDKPFKPWI